MKQLEVFSVRVEMPTNQPIVLLREIEGERYLPIWIGANEASSIAFAQQGIEAIRPLTHDLINLILQELNQKLEMVEITELKDGVFYAELCFFENKRVSCRPSDAIAIALKAGVPIYCADQVIDDAGIVVEEGADSEAEVEAFREFLDQVTPEDFS